MFVTRCDLCKKIARGGAIRVNPDMGPAVDLCKGCAFPIQEFLSKKELIPKYIKQK